MPRCRFRNLQMVVRIESFTFHKIDLDTCFHNNHPCFSFFLKKNTILQCYIVIISFFSLLYLAWLNEIELIPFYDRTSFDPFYKRIQRFDTITGTGKAIVKTPTIAHKLPTILPKNVFGTISP